LSGQRIREVSVGVGAAHSAQATVDYTHEFAPTVNDPACVAVAEDAAIAVLGSGRVDAQADPIMASEDFGVLASQVPGCLALLGNGTSHGVGGAPLHCQEYCFKRHILRAGVDYYSRVVRDLLR
jgi:hippurate hydrolase